MPIRDRTHLKQLRSTIDVDSLRSDMAAIGERALDGRAEHAVSEQELEKAFDGANASILKKYGVDVWDAMVLLAPEPSDET